MKFVLIGLLILMALAGLGSHLALRGTTAAHAGLEEHNKLVVHRDHIVANGIVEGARPEIALRPEVTGTIACLHYRENQEVTKGTLLIELSNEVPRQQVALAQAEVEIAQAQLERLRNGERTEKRQALAALEKAKHAAYEQARSAWARSRKMVSNRSASEEQFDGDQFRMVRAEAEWQEAKAEHALIEAPARVEEVAAAQGRVASAQAHLSLARAELAKTQLRAPCNGRITQVFSEPGEMASAQSPQPILLMADVSKHRVRTFVEELDAASVRVGQTALVTADGLPGKEFAGHVAIVLPRMGKRSPQTDNPGEYKDIYFREVLVDLDAGQELPLNFRVFVHIPRDS